MGVNKTDGLFRETIRQVFAGRTIFDRFILVGTEIRFWFTAAGTPNIDIKTLVKRKVVLAA